MSLQTPLLSVCIPTFNRAALLRQALDAVLAQIPPSRAAQVEVVVSDNASTDATPEVIAEAQAAHPHVRLRGHRRVDNGGPDANIYQAFQLAEGEFVFFLSDDDLLLPGAVETLLGLIAAHPDLDAFTLNVRVFRDDLREILPAEIPVSADVVTRDKNEALLLLNTWIRYLSGMAFRRARVAGRDYSGRIGTYFVQAYLFLDVLTEGRGLLITAQPYIAQRDGNMTVFDYCRVYVTNFAALMDHAKSLGFARRAIRPITRRNIRIIRDVVYANTVRSAWGAFVPSARDAVARLLRAYPFDPVVLFQIVPVLLVPPKVVPPLYALYRRVKIRLKAGRQPI